MNKELNKINIVVGQSGGPTAAINSSLAGVYETATQRGLGTVYGMRFGIKGFLNEDIIDLSQEMKNQFSIELLKRTPSSFLGSCRYKLPEPILGDPVFEKVFEVLEKYHIKIFIYIGGNDSMDTIKKLYDYGEMIHTDVKFIGVPKTIDNDLPCTERTFGFDTAMAVATEALDRIHTTAESHHRVMALEVMGRYAGWIALHSGIAGGADVILLPEIPYDIDIVAERIKTRQ